MKNRRQFLYIEKKNHSCFFSSLFLLLFPRLLNLENKKKFLCKKNPKKKKKKKERDIPPSLKTKSGEHFSGSKVKTRSHMC